MRHKYKVIHFLNNKQVCECKKEEINPILYLNDFYNFIDKKQFDGAYGHKQGSKDETYNILKKYLKALEIIKKQGYIGGLVNALQNTKNYEQYNNFYINQYTKEEYDLLKEVLL